VEADWYYAGFDYVIWVTLLGTSTINTNVRFDLFPFTVELYQGSQDDTEDGSLQNNWAQKAGGQTNYDPTANSNFPFKNAFTTTVDPGVYLLRIRQSSAFLNFGTMPNNSCLQMPFDVEIDVEKPSGQKVVFFNPAFGSCFRPDFMTFQVGFSEPIGTQGTIELSEYDIDENDDPIRVITPTSVSLNDQRDIINVTFNNLLETDFDYKLNVKDFKDDDDNTFPKASVSVDTDTDVCND